MVVRDTSVLVTPMCPVARYTKLPNEAHGELMVGKISKLT